MVLGQFQDGQEKANRVTNAAERLLCLPSSQSRLVSGTPNILERLDRNKCIGLGARLFVSIPRVLHVGEAAQACGS